MSNDVSAPAGGRRALWLLVSKRPRNVGWQQAGGLLFGDWGTSRLYVLGLAFFFAGRTSFYLICAMSLLILAVGWAYTQICRIYPDGGGVYTAAKHRNQTLAVIGALLLFADYVVTASLSVLDSFHYFGLSDKTAEMSIFLSPALWAIVAIMGIGAFNLMGPKHTGGFALATAVGMMVITLLITAGALPQINWHHFAQSVGSLQWHALPTTRPVESLLPSNIWTQFASIMLALSGVEAIANLTGVMKRPVARTARRAIWVVAIEVAVFNILLSACMVAIFQSGAPGQAEHRDDMLAFLSGAYIGKWAEWSVRIVGGLLLLSAGNTAITDMISVQYLMARDGELPRTLQKLNGFGVPWIPALIAASVPALVVFISPDVEQLSHLYAIGVIGAVSINVALCAFHPRLRKFRRKIPMMALGTLLLGIWVTLAYEKQRALVFVLVVMAVGLLARWLTKRFAKPSTSIELLHQAIAEQLSPAVFDGPKVMLATAGSSRHAKQAMDYCKQRGAALVVTFIRQVTLTPLGPDNGRMTIETDTAAQTVFAEFLQAGHEYGVQVIPAYDAGDNSAELLAEQAAVCGVDEVLLGSSRRNALHKLIKGSFQRKLELLLPPEIRVSVLEGDDDTPPAPTGGEMLHGGA